jgi:pimeloyl-ACP methyl ester carboxylesterase
MDKIKIHGIDLAYHRRGHGAPLMLLHGYPLDHSIWDRAADLLDPSFDLILPDLRGFGESETMADLYSIADMARDAAGLLDALKIDQAFIAGHSMGGYIALAFARLFPERVHGLGLIASQAIADTPAGKEARYAAIEQIKAKGVGVVVESMPAKLSSDPRVQKHAAESIAKQRTEGIVGALHALAERDDSTPHLSFFKIPVVIVHGDNDLLIPIDRAREVKAAIPHAHLIELAGAGHMPMMEKPKETAEGLKKLV